MPNFNSPEGELTDVFNNVRQQADIRLNIPQVPLADKVIN